ncbi:MULTISPECIES: LysE family transporter [Bacillus cereus group]|uniref:LysE family transporter n=1 Tax=Bacillus cereus group TaxID=86661 RepID=UPI000B42D331|nr:LysE family transporter [Bacillus thuringiensis]MED3181322.1 LysE family transporter [Bacillus thuringiensis]OTY08151.1 lysine transporter LysE [Bacillus thuringiensis serovar kim]OUB17807.1 lysine transporter LysE [Bacillus thuringiensis serovar xiaguangiensis]PEV37663.1 lysine transporter LysE [Bacillus thuringiensis]PGU91966.1 lysine transporter LysE [Bacillus thuringiensis]
MPIFSFLLFVFISSFTPGPNNFLAMTYANQHGLKRSINFCFGVAFGFFILTSLCSFFNIVLINIIPIIEIPLKILGAAYMLYLAFKIITSKGRADHNEKNNKNLFTVGIFIQFVNPKGILFGLTVVSTFILPYYNSYSSFLLFSLFLGIVGLLSTFSWSLFGSIFQKSLVKHNQLFNIIMAVLLVFSAVSIVIH